MKELAIGTGLGIANYIYLVVLVNIDLPRVPMLALLLLIPFAVASFAISIRKAWDLKTTYLQCEAVTVSYAVIVILSPIFAEKFMHGFYWKVELGWTIVLISGVGFFVLSVVANAIIKVLRNSLSKK